MVRSFLWLGGFALTLGLAAAAWAGQATYPSPRPCPNACVPNVGSFGYFPTTWRQWPGEKRLEVINQRAVGVQVLPTPEGQEYVPAPVVPQETPYRAPGGELLPPGGAILPPQEPEPQHELPAEPQTPAEGGLPGLPVEPDSEVLPGLPENGQPTEQPKSPSSETGPGLQWESRDRATAATQFEMRQPQPRSTVVLLVDGQALGESRVEPASHYADLTVATEPDAPAKEGVEAAAYAMVESAASAEAGSGTTTVMPPVAMDGYCPVDLMRNGRWTPGDLRYTVVHDGRMYRLSGSAEWQEFQANPNAFTPAYAGNDSVLSTDQQRLVPGQLLYCATYNGRLYMFSSAATQAQFNENPRRYAVEK